MSKELVRELRTAGTGCSVQAHSTLAIYVSGICTRAADHIEALESRLTRARELLRQFRELHPSPTSQLGSEIDAFLSESDGFVEGV